MIKIKLNIDKFLQWFFQWIHFHFQAQGHSVRDENITMRQRLKNAYIELRWGFMYNNFPWELKSEYQTDLIYLRNNLINNLIES